MNGLKGIAVSIGVLFVAQPLVGAARAEKKVAELKAPRTFNRKNAERHLRDHQRYPVTKAQLLAECDELSDFTPSDKKWLADTLPDRSYSSPDAVLDALGLKLAKK